MWIGLDMLKWVAVCRNEMKLIQVGRIYRRYIYAMYILVCIYIQRQGGTNCMILDGPGPT